MASVHKYVKSKGEVTWNTVYKKFGIKKVNRAINSGKIYAGMSGKARALG